MNTDNLERVMIDLLFFNFGGIMGLELKIKDAFNCYFITKITDIIRYIGYTNAERDLILAKYRDEVLFKICDKFDNATELKGYMINIIKKASSMTTTEKSTHDFETVAIAYAYDGDPLFKLGDFIELCRSVENGTPFIPDLDTTSIGSTQYYDVIDSSDLVQDTERDPECNLAEVLPKIKKYFTGMRATYPIDDEKAHEVLEPWLNSIAPLYKDKRIKKYTFDSIIEYAEFLETCDYEDAEPFSVSLDDLDLLFRNVDTDLDLIKVESIIKCFQEVYYGVEEKKEFQLGDLVKATIDGNDVIAAITGHDETRYIVHPIARYGEWDDYVIEATKLILVEFKNS